MCPEAIYNINNKYSILSRPAFHLCVLVLLASLIFFYNLGGWDLWNPDEPRYAQVAREMAEDGNWIIPRLNNRIYPDKPPVFFWLIALSYALSGEVSSFSARFPSALAGVLGVLLTYFMGRKIKSPRAGFISALVLATTLEYFWLGRRANIDMTLTLFILSALFCFYKGYRDESPRFYYLFYLSMGLATLTKGPVGFILPLLTAVSYLMARKDLNGLKRIVFPPGLMLFFALILAWLVPTALVGDKGYLDEIIFNQILGRVYDSWSHKEPFYYYILAFPPLVMPWVFFLPGAFIYCFRRNKRTQREDILFPAIWFVTMFVFFSLCSGKRTLYLLPLVPACALMVGLLWDRLLEHDTERWIGNLVRIPCYLLLGSLIASAAALPWFSAFFKSEYRQGLNFYPPALIACLSATGVLICFLRKRAALTLAMLVVMVAGGCIYSAHYVFPLLNDFNSARPFSLRIKSLMKEDDLLVSFFEKNAAYIFYTGIEEIKELETPTELVTLLMNSRQRVFCLMYKEDYEKIQSVVPFRIFPWLEGKVEDHELLLVSNRERS